MDEKAFFERVGTRINKTENPVKLGVNILKLGCNDHRLVLDRDEIKFIVTKPSREVDRNRCRKVIEWPGPDFPERSRGKNRNPW